MRESILEDIFEAFIGGSFLDFNNEKNGFISNFRCLVFKLQKHF